MPTNPFRLYESIVGGVYTRMLPAMDPEDDKLRERQEFLEGLAPSRQRRAYSQEERQFTEAQRSLRDSLRPDFRSAESRYGLPEGLLERLALQESSFVPRAGSVEGVTGLMQIHRGVHGEELGKLGLDPDDPRDAIEFAGQYLSKLHDRFGSWDLALAAYNAGQGRVAQAGGIPDISETQAFVRDILLDVEQPSSGSIANLERHGLLQELGIQPDATRVVESADKRPGGLPVPFARFLSDEGQAAWGALLRGDSELDRAMKDGSSRSLMSFQKVQEFVREVTPEPIRDALDDLVAWTDDWGPFVMFGGVTPFSRTRMLRAKQKIERTGDHPKLVNESVSQIESMGLVQHSFDYRTPDGQAISYLINFRQGQPQKAYIDFVINTHNTSSSRKAWQNSPHMRWIMGDLVERFPDVTRVDFDRVSGIRALGREFGGSTRGVPFRDIIP
jgi:hypothetical protein